jgi:YVTN family beta-propeller protein
VFVSTGRGRSVVIIDTATNTPTGAVEVGERPWGIAVTPDGTTVFTANGPSNDVSFVDVPSRTVIARVKVGDRPWGVAYLPDQDRH